MRALAGKLPSSGRSGPTPQAGFPPLPEGEGEEAPPRLQLNGKTRWTDLVRGSRRHGQSRGQGTSDSAEATTSAAILIASL